MKIFKWVIGLTIVVVGLFAGFNSPEEELQMDDSIFPSMGKISISRMFDLEQIVVSVADDLEHPRFYQITAIALDGQMTDENLEKELKLCMGDNQLEGVKNFLAGKNNNINKID